MTSALFSPPRDHATTGWQDTEPWVRYGMRVIVGLIGGSFLFMSLVPISGAVIAPGSVTIEGNYKTVQHLDGGIVAKILVRNGDRVKAGDALVKIDDTQVRASLAVTRQRVVDLSIQKARLEAERDGLPALVLPPGLDAASPATALIVTSQTNLFEARRASETGQQSVLRQRLSQLQDQGRGLESQLAATLKQKDISARELGSVLPLFEKGFVNQQRVAPLQRESARLEGEVGRLKAEMAKARNAMGETEMQIAQSNKVYLSQVTDELRKVEAALAEQQETEAAMLDRVRRTDVVAPAGGFVHALAVHTEGGVVTAASPILQIIPDGGKLIVEAQVLPQSIDKVHAGLPATVRFPAFDSHTTPRITGEVIKVSPAQLSDDKGGTYFTAQIEVAPAELAKIGRGHALVPGMPAEVFIETSSRSMLSYLVKPLADMMSHAFRE